MFSNLCFLFHFFFFSFLGVKVLFWYREENFARKNIAAGSTMDEQNLLYTYLISHSEHYSSAVSCFTRSFIYFRVGKLQQKQNWDKVFFGGGFYAVFGAAYHAHSLTFRHGLSFAPKFTIQSRELNFYI